VTLIHQLGSMLFGCYSATKSIGHNQWHLVQLPTWKPDFLLALLSNSIATCGSKKKTRCNDTVADFMKKITSCVLYMIFKGPGVSNKGILYGSCKRHCPLSTL